MFSRRDKAPFSVKYDLAPKSQKTTISISRERAVTAFIINPPFVAALRRFKTIDDFISGRIYKLQMRSGVIRLYKMADLLDHTLVKVITKLRLFFKF